MPPGIPLSRHVPAPTADHVPALSWTIIRDIEVERNL
ncbi:hypothetical protein GXY_15594 [Novacetimonas hansenii ATCC 23769]|uniref:Uncharacterized protein n=1 Tax=Novacetimonas hansenii ATCC 23769 TaxID=714995 RepID=D5QIY7_NOVHA|nr:hypothetical protein GXY_15594 [Novacetimonas hansenii ATCC 23769]